MPWYRIVQLSIIGLGLLAGAVRFSKLNPASRLMLGLLVVSATTELVSFYLGRISHQNVIVSYFFIPIQYTFIAWAYQNELTPYRRWIVGSIFSFGLLCVVYTLLNLYRWLDYYPTEIRTVANLLIIACSLVWFRALLGRADADAFSHYPMFWFSTGWLLFTVLTLFNFSALNYLADNALFPLLFRYIRISANFVLYTLFIVAFCSRQRTLTH